VKDLNKALLAKKKRLLSKLVIRKWNKFGKHKSKGGILTKNILSSS
jgi:hypothetical protein